MLSAIKSVVLPCAAPSLFSRLNGRSVRLLFRFRLRYANDFEQRDRVMALLAPMVLLSLLTTWLMVIFVSYSAMFFALGHHSIKAAIEISGSSLVTLGTVSDPRFWPAVLSFTEAGLGLLLVALFISYFPSIYAAFIRRSRA